VRTPVPAPPLRAAVIDLAWQPSAALAAEVRGRYRGDDSGFAFQVARFVATYSGQPLAQAPVLFRRWMLRADPAKEPRAAGAAGGRTPLPAAVVRPTPTYFTATGWQGGARR
jgi:hypothetical protein